MDDFSGRIALIANVEVQAGFAVILDPTNELVTLTSANVLEWST